MNAFIVNIEPFLARVRMADNVEFGITDYSQQNVDTMRSNQFIIDNKIPTNYIPYQYNQQDVDKLRSYATGKKKIFICGGMSDKRASLVEKLREHHCINVAIVTGFGDQRDIEMMRYKMMLNISRCDDYNIYEHIRCDRLIFAKMVIISDYKQSKETLDLYGMIVWTPIDGIENTIYDVMKNYETYKSRITDDKIELIALERKNKYARFRSPRPE